jgi:protein tyrosine phosphatase
MGAIMHKVCLKKSSLIILGFLSILTLQFSLIDTLQAKPAYFNAAFPSLPQQHRDNHFKAVQTGFEERSNLFLKGKQYHPWQFNRPDTEIIEEFKTLDEWRFHTWYSDITRDVLISRPDFMIAQDLLEKGYFFKRPHLIAFDYNNTDNTFNSSSIVLNGYRFLALEAPKLPTLGNFFRLLQNHRVTQLVRLTSAEENGEEKSYPYWPGNVEENSKKQTLLNIPFHSEGLKNSKYNYVLKYYPLESWKDNRGIDPSILLNLIEKVRKDYDPENGLLACHCTGGVGRTGTFIAGFLLLQEIDRQIAAGISIDALNISIEKIVTQLALQRVHMVAKPAQYVTLYRLVDLYVKNLKSNSKITPTKSPEVKKTQS